MIRRSFVLVLLLFSISICLFSQQTYFGLGAGLGGFSRSGEWAKTYGSSMLGSFRAEFGLAKGLTFSGRGDVLFGNSVKIDPIAALRLSSGLVAGDLATQGGPANVALKSRGWRGSVLLGYRFPIGTQGWSLRASAGPAYLLHFIRIQDDPLRTTSSLQGDYKRGYDRRAAGLGLSADAGIMYTNAPGSFMAFLLVNYDQAATSPLNSVQFDLQAAGPEAGTDRSVGLSLGLMLGLWRGGDGRSSDDIYY